MTWVTKNIPTNTVVSSHHRFQHRFTHRFPYHFHSWFPYRSPKDQATHAFTKKFDAKFLPHVSSIGKTQWDSIGDVEHETSEKTTNKGYAASQPSLDLFADSVSIGDAESVSNSLGKDVWDRSY